jgi:hypothetical protein
LSSRHEVVYSDPRCEVITVGSAYDVDDSCTGDVVVMGSYTGVLPARFVSEHRPRGVIGVDCAIGKDGAGIAGLWYFEALEIPAATIDVATVELGNGPDVFDTGVVSRVNALAAAIGVHAGMTARQAAMLMVERDPVATTARDVTNRTVMWTDRSGCSIVCTDSIAFGLPEDRGRNVLCTAGHTGRTSVEYIERVAPRGFISSDGGRGKNNAGTAGLYAVEALGLAGATVAAETARMGDGLSTYEDGVISACNSVAAARGVRVGQTSKEAARLLLAHVGDPMPGS